jgi:hypothetical protein
MRGKIALWLDLKWGQGHKSASLTQELVPLLGGVTFACQNPLWYTYLVALPRQEFRTLAFHAGKVLGLVRSSWQ